MEKFTNLCPKDNLTNPKSVHNAIAGCGGPLWEETKDYQCELAKEIDKRGIPFALVEDGNLLSIYVSKKDYKNAKKAVV
ncbi:MAG TPA: hypothetical protein VJ103_02580 [Candidatus Paceibacterota bacterium]|nr:hypothetical protein [Candidatus Paceibacterota bacterium]